ncbi:uncharacterized protein LOC135367560 [Ornithodoros turicata]|uniref:uncharacterized protein LOC135367560 n=1 Tax=Ornithodoros turicata TaxID=34597 RepID=UPI0031397E39
MGDLQEKLDVLKVKEAALQQLNASTEALITDDKEYDDEIASSQTYEDNICIAKSRALQNLSDENVRIAANTSGGQRQAAGGNSTVETSTNAMRTAVKLPKLEIPKFNGDLRNWNSFWDQFDSTINRNQSINKIDKFKYLRSYLTDKAAISGLSLTAGNYDVALKLLKERFNKRNLIINEHLA